MSKQFFFMFSEGSYSDYQVGGLFIADHAVSPDDWKAHYESFQNAEVEMRKEMILAFGERTGNNVRVPNWSGVSEYISAGNCIKGWWNSCEKAALDVWLDENNPETTFQDRHGMVTVECTEMWRD